jgi:uncharacterized protein (DUF2235 family)
VPRGRFPIDAHSDHTGGFGYGLEDNVLDAYNFLMNNFSHGDEIFIFGFSRGAFTARILANFIARVGVFRKPTYTWELKKAWKAYRGGSDAFDVYIRDLETHSARYDSKDPLKPRTFKPAVKVLGCWDTVAAMGLPDYAKWIPLSDKYNYLDGSLVPGSCLGSATGMEIEALTYLQASSMPSTRSASTSAVSRSARRCSSFPRATPTLRVRCPA